MTFMTRSWYIRKKIIDEIFFLLHAHVTDLMYIMEIGIFFQKFQISSIINNL